MTAVLADPPVLVLGVGNLLRRDDGAGLRMLEVLSDHGFGEGVEFMDGGTQGLALLSHLASREVLLVLDALKLGDPPGTIHVLRGSELANTVHESNTLELLAYAHQQGILPREVVAIGIEPESIRTGVGLTKAVESAIHVAVTCASGVIQNARSKLACA